MSDQNEQNQENEKNNGTGDSQSSESTNDAQDLSPEARAEALEDELAQFKDRYMRAVAEMENVKRRADKDRTDALRYGLEGLFRDFLPVLDSFEQAVGNEDGKEQSEQNDKSFFSGILMVRKLMLDVLKKHGLEQIEAKDQPFDPNFHQAIQRVESAEHKEETVAGEFQKGYVLNGRLIRPAMVSVFIPV